LALAFVDLVLLLQQDFVVDLSLGQTGLESLGEPQYLFLHGRHRLFQLYNLHILVSFRILQTRISLLV
jgi:hypothetical protein